MKFEICFTKINRSDGSILGSIKYLPRYGFGLTDKWLVKNDDLWDDVRLASGYEAALNYLKV